MCSLGSPHIERVENFLLRVLISILIDYGYGFTASFLHWHRQPSNGAENGPEMEIIHLFRNEYPSVTCHDAASDVLVRVHQVSRMAKHLRSVYDLRNKNNRHNISKATEKLFTSFKFSDKPCTHKMKIVNGC